MLQDDEKTVIVAHLVYVSDTDEGFKRRRRGKKFKYC